MKKRKKIRVIQINKLYYPVTGGIEQVVRQLAEGLKEKTEMKVLVCRDKGKAVGEYIHGVPVYRSASLGMFGNLPIPLGLTRNLRKLSKTCDILQFHMPFPFGDLAGLFSGFHGKIVVWWHSDIVRQKKLMQCYRPVMECFLQRADRIIVATQGHIDGSEYLQPFREKCVVIPFGVDPELEIRADLYWNQVGRQKNQRAVIEKKEGLRFLFIGRLVYYKGCDILLEAFAGLQQSGNCKHHLVIAGSGPLEGELKKSAKKFHITEHVCFTGALTQEELYQELESCDVLVLPSVARSEAFGLVQLEAMVFGKPVINTWLPSGVPYVSLNQQTGLTVAPGNQKELEEAMRLLWDKPELRCQMGIRARERVKQEFQIKKMIERVELLYQELLNEES